MNPPLSPPPPLIADEPAPAPTGASRSGFLLLILILVAIGATWITGLLYKRYLIEEQRSLVEREVTESANRLRATILDRLSLLESLEALVVSRQQSARIKEVFPSFARGLSSSNPGIASLFLAPDFTVDQIYPLSANPSVLGRSLTDAQWQDRTAVLQALRSRQVVVSDSRPFDNGNLGLRAYKTVTVAGKVWGAAGIAIDLSRLLELTRIGTGFSGLQYSIRTIDGPRLSGPAEVYANDPVRRRLRLPGAHWELAAAPISPWNDLVSAELLMFRGYVLVLILLLGVVAWFLFSREHWMAQIVDERTHELDRANARLRDENRQRQQAEKSLRERESLLRTTFEQSSAGIVQLRLDGRLFNLNRAFAHMLGYEPHELLNRDIRSLAMDPAAIEIDLESTAADRRPEAAVVQRQLLNRDNLPVWVNLSISLVRPGGMDAACYLLVGQDVGEHKRAEQTLRQNERMAQRLFLEAPTPSLLLAENSGAIIAINHAAQSLLGTDVEAIAGQIMTAWADAGTAASDAATNLSVEKTDAPDGQAERLDCRVQTMATGTQTGLLCVFSAAARADMARADMALAAAARRRLDYVRQLQTLLLDLSTDTPPADTLVRRISARFDGKIVAMFKLAQAERGLHLLATVGPGATLIAANFSRYPLSAEELAELQHQAMAAPVKLARAPQAMAAALKMVGLSQAWVHALRLDDSLAGVLVLAQTGTDGTDSIAADALEDLAAAGDAACGLLQFLHLAELLEIPQASGYVELAQHAVGLRATASRYQSMAAGSPHCLWLADAGGELIDVNDSWCRVSGADRDESLGQGWINFIALDQREETLHQYRRRIDAGNRFSLTLALSGEAESGHLRFTARPLLGVDSRIKAWALAGADAIVDARLLQSAQSRSAELLAFSRSMSHDLHAPLRSIQGFAQLIMEDCAGVEGSRCRDYAERLTRAAKRLGRLVEDLLAYTRMQDAEIGTDSVDLNGVVEEVLHQLEADITASEAALQIEWPLARVYGHHATLVAVVSNLIGNALKFKRADTAPQIRIFTEPGPADVRLWVEDQGIGIDPEHRARIFRPFERLHSQDEFPGSGLGLSLVADALRRMGGESGVEAAAGGGCRFWLQLRTVTAPDAL